MHCLLCGFTDLCPVHFKMSNLFARMFTESKSLKFLCKCGLSRTFSGRVYAAIFVSSWLPANISRETAACGSEPLVPVLPAGAPLWEGTSTVARNTSEVRCSPVIMGWTFCPWVCEFLGRQC